MHEHDNITKNVDLDRIAGNALRQADAKRVIGELGKCFEARTVTMPTDKALGDLDEKLRGLTSQLVAISSTDGIGFEMTPPYESFKHGDISMDSRIARKQLMGEAGTSSSFSGGTLYLLGITAEGQTAVDTDNFVGGVMVLGNGETTFFKVAKDENYGYTTVEGLEPEEQFAMVQEFKKALASTGPQQQK